MAVSYRKLWKLLIDKDMKKKDLRLATGISTNAIAKLGKNDRVSTDILEKICLTLGCDVGDIMEITEDVPPKQLTPAPLRTNANVKSDEIKNNDSAQDNR